MPSGALFKTHQGRGRAKTVQPAHTIPVPAHINLDPGPEAEGGASLVVEQAIERHDRHFGYLQSEKLRFYRHVKSEGPARALRIQFEQRKYVLPEHLEAHGAVGEDRRREPAEG